MTSERVVLESGRQSAWWVAGLTTGAAIGCALALAEPPKAGGPGLLPTTAPSGVVMVLIPAGEFRMGSEEGDAEADVDERPVHTVRLDAFYIDRDLVTQAEFERVMGSNPSKWKDRPTNPAEQVRWSDAARYCNARSQAEGLQECYDLDSWRCDFTRDGYRLPTEAEWEYACRAGTRTKYFFGEDAKMLQVYAWYAANSGRLPRPVGRKQPNPWGLNDICGNVRQWCNDFYQADYYKTGPAANPRGPEKGEFKVVRGGSWDSPAAHCRSAARFKENPAFVRACFGLDTFGFRCVRAAPAATTQPAPASQPRAASQPAPAAGVGFVYDELYLRHTTTPGHPERAERLTAIVDRLKKTRLLEQLVELKARDAEEKWLTEIHSAEYVKRVRESAADAPAYLDSRDTPVAAKSHAAAVRAAGGVLAAVDAVVAGKVRSAFCAVRPPGHHALRERAMGFCLFNNVAVAARYVQKRHRLGKVLIVDWDVHHGNGTQAAFYDDPTVLYFSTHRSPFYPGTGAADETGEGKGKGFTLNVPLPAGAGDADLKKAFLDRLLPAADAFKPDFVLISAGFDAHADDPLGGFTATPKGFAELTRIVKAIAEKHCLGRCVSVLEGGYDLKALAESVEAHLRALGQP